MRTYMTNGTTRRRATLIGLAIVSAALFGSLDVGRTFTTRQLNERYSAVYVNGENSASRIEATGAGTGGQGRADLTRQVTGAGDAEVQKLNGSIARPTANPNSNSNCGNLEARK